MSEREAYDTCRTYLALKMHFDMKSNYDYFRYHGKTAISRDAWNMRRDKFNFYKLSKQKNPKDFILANIVDDTIGYSGDLVTDKAQETYKKWQDRKSTRLNSSHSQQSRMPSSA